MTSTGWRNWARALVALWLVIMTPQGVSDGGRLALVIGNGAYAEGPLVNPVNDATDFAAKLRELGFQAELLLNADQQAMEQAIDSFTRTLTGQGKVGLFYFAGHGIEYQGHNYLLPIGAVIRGAVDLRYKAVDAGRVLDGMSESGNGLNLVVLDACRNNPFPSVFRSASRGLARLSPAKGTLVLYATQPGSVASDGVGRNGVFTKHLLAALAEPGLEVEQAFKRTALAVDQETGGAQTPWVEGVVLGHFAFVPAATAPMPVTPGTVPSPVAPPPPVQTGHLQINVNVAAQVRIDDRYSGEATPERPLNLTDLPVGPHRITVSAIGYRNKHQDTQVQAGLWTQEIMRLSAEQAQAPRPIHPDSGRLGDHYPLSSKRIGPGDRYIDHENGTVTDVETGLMWMRCAVGQTWTVGKCKGKAKEITWDNAQTYTLNYAGYSDWRLPSIRELGTIVYCSNGQPGFYSNGKNASDAAGDWGCYGKPVKDHIRPTLAPDVFPNSPASLFWSSSRDTPLPGPNGIFFGYGSVSNANGTGFTHIRMVR